MYILPYSKTILLLVLNITSRYSLFGIINSKFSTCLQFCQLYLNTIYSHSLHISANLKSGFKYHLIYIDDFQTSFPIPDFSHDSQSTVPTETNTHHACPPTITPTQDPIRPKTISKWFSTGQLWPSGDETSEDIFGCHNLGEGRGISIVWRPKMSLTSYNARDRHPYQKCTWPQMSMALRQTNPTHEAQLSLLSHNQYLTNQQILLVSPTK